MTKAIARAWPTKRLKYGVALRRARVAGTDDERPYVGLEQIESGTGRLLPTDVDLARESDVPATNGESLNNSFEPGDVLFGKLRPYLAKAWMAEFSGRCTTELVVMQPITFDARYLRYVCLSRTFVDAVDASTFGSKMPRADWDFIGNMGVPVPPSETQAAIADYLDTEMARLDGLLAAKARVLDLLEEKRRSLITRATTSGLDDTAPRRDSGISWLPTIPAHWEVERGKWLFRERDERSENGDEELLTVSHITGVTPRSEKDVNMFEAETMEGYKIALAGDLVINTLWAWMGAMGISPVDGIVSPAYNVYQLGPRLDPAFVDLLVRVPVFAQEVIRHSKGVWSSRLRLYPEGFFEVFFAVPPIAEQRAIVTYVEAHTRKLNAVRSATERTIALLKERRAALIAAAVTGELSVEDIQCE